MYEWSGKIYWDVEREEDCDICLELMKTQIVGFTFNLLVMMKTIRVTIDRQFLILPVSRSSVDMVEISSRWLQSCWIDDQCVERLIFSKRGVSYDTIVGSVRPVPPVRVQLNLTTSGVPKSCVAMVQWFRYDAEGVGFLTNGTPVQYYLESKDQLGE